MNITDEEKQKLKRHSFVGGSGATDSNRPFLDMVLASMDCVENDYLALLALCLVYALANNKGGHISKAFDFAYNLKVYRPKHI